MLAFLQHETSQPRGVRRTSWCQWGIARVRGLWRHEASTPCMFASLRHETSQARGASDEGAGASGERARVQGLWRHEASIPCMFACLQHETSQAREASDERAGASWAGRGFEASGVTWQSSPACWHSCNTRHRRHARRRMRELAPVGRGRCSRPVASRGVHPLHVGIPATQDIAGMRGVR